jgi:chromosomal replication initiator protein
MADIQPPETETKVAILKQCSLSENLHLPNDVAFFLASNVRSNIRELEGMLTRVAAFASLNCCEITLDLAKEVLKDLIGSSGKGVLDITTIQKVVSGHFKISLSDLKSKRKQKNIVFPRQICMYLARNLTKMSYPEIAARFGGKDHSTVIYSVNKIESSLVLDKQLKSSIDTLISKLTQ